MIIDIFRVSVFLIAITLFAETPPGIRVTLLALDPDGAPVAGVKVAVGGAPSASDRAYPRQANGETDVDGHFTATITSGDGLMYAFAFGAKHYRTDLPGLDWQSESENPAKHLKRGKDGIPECLVKLVVKPIKKPIPLCAKRVDTIVPALGKPVGYDVEKGDWVAPYGKGERVDLEFTAMSRFDSDDNYDSELRLYLPGDATGILSYELGSGSGQRSALRMPYEAPEVGYNDKWTWRNTCTTAPGIGQFSVMVDESKPQRCFFFRVRTVLNPRGDVISAHYGKIHGPVSLRVYADGKTRLEFTYYFNPTASDRNLEYDIKRNLIPGLTWEETPRDP